MSEVYIFSKEWYDAVFKEFTEKQKIKQDKETEMRRIIGLPRRAGMRRNVRELQKELDECTATLKEFDEEKGQCAAQYFYPGQEVNKDGYQLPSRAEYREVSQDKEVKPGGNQSE